MNEYYGIPSIPTQDFLAHYGIPGMKWGVRKAIIKGDHKAFEKHFRKAAKKLAKLQDKALNSGKYAAKAAGYGAAAASAGALAIGGTGIASKGIKAAGKAIEGTGRAMIDSRKHAGIGNVLRKAGHGLSTAGESVDTWGKNGKYNVVKKTIKDRNGKIRVIEVYSNNPKNKSGLSNNDKFRIGAGVAALGLGAASARNAYIASHGRKYMDKAEEFKRAMDDSFAGTKYQGHYIAPPKQRKRRRG